MEYISKVTNVTVDNVVKIAEEGLKSPKQYDTEKSNLSRYVIILSLLIINMKLLKQHKFLLYNSNIINNFNIKNKNNNYNSTFISF